MDQRRAVDALALRFGQAELRCAASRRFRHTA
jgi:hypothetical protein